MRRTVVLLFLVLLLALPSAGLAEAWTFIESWDASESEASGSETFESETFESETFGTTLYIVNCEEYVSLRAQPDTSAEALARIPLGTAVTCYGDVGNDFSEVAYQGMTGYVLTRYLGSNAPVAAAEAESEGETMYVVNCQEYVTLRSGPSTSTDAMAHIPLGTAVMTYGSDGDFIRVEYEGLRGYVLNEYLDYSPMSFSAYLGSDAGYARLDTASIEVSASSEQVDQYGYYSAANANDADGSTAWAEGADGVGEGEWLSFFFDERAVAGFAIRAGYQKSAETYNNNARPARICVSVAGESDCYVTLEDRRGEQVVLFQYPVVSDYLSIEIVSAYSGTSYADTCISDVRILLAD